MSMLWVILLSLLFCGSLLANGQDKTLVIAYSYIRFSSQEQSHGDSLRRQIQLRDEWLKRHPNVRLDTRTRYTDKGKSGRGQHLHAAMGAFLAKIQAGEIAPGSILIVENLDRLGRLPVSDQLSLFLQIIQAGITIVSTMDGAEYSRDRLNSEYGMGYLLSSISIMKRAYDESETKSKRSTENWKNIRASKKVGTMRVPGWIAVKDGRFTLVEERAAIVRRIFQLTAQGFGKDRITATFNQEGIETWGVGKQKGRAWHDTYITKVLNSPAVIGQFQWHTLRFREELGRSVREPIGEPIENHFPRVVTQRLYERARRIRSSRAGRPGRIGQQVRNLFTGMAFCSHTGFPIVFSNKNPHFYLKTSMKSRRGKNLTPWPYDHFEEIFINFIGELDTSALVDPSIVPEREAMEEKISLLQAESQKLEKTVTRALSVLGDVTEEDLGVSGNFIRETEGQIKDVRAELDTVKESYRKICESSAKAEESLSGIRLLQSKRHDSEFRLRLRDELPNLIEAIFIDLDARHEFAFRKEVDFRNLVLTDATEYRREYEAAKRAFFRVGGQVRTVTILFKTGVVRSIHVQTLKGNIEVRAEEGTGRGGDLVRDGKRTRLLLREKPAVEVVRGDETNSAARKRPFVALSLKTNWQKVTKGRNLIGISVEDYSKGGAEKQHPRRSDRSASAWS